jgi:hypothetical protein
MFRRLLVLACVAVIAAGAFPWQAQAAPVTGSFTMSLDFWGAWFYTGEPTKIDKILVHWYADLNLTLSISGLELNSQTHFTFAGLSAQVLQATATVGAMTFNNWLVFAPDICETDYYGVGFYTVCAGDFTDPVTFRKKVAEVTLNIAGLTLGLRALFANLGPAGTPNFQSGLVLILSGQTVSGITVRSETWVGAWPGVECFSNDLEDSPLFPACQVYLDNGIVIPGFNFNLEALTLTGVKLAGVTHNVVILMNFSGTTLIHAPTGQSLPSTSLQPSFVEITSTGRVDPLRLTVANRLRLFNGFTSINDRINFSITIGEASASWYLYIFPGVTGAYNIRTAAVALQYDPPGMTVQNLISFCTTDTGTGIDALRFAVFPSFLPPVACRSGTDGIRAHYIGFEGSVGDLSVFIAARSAGSLIGNFDAVAINAEWNVGGITVSSTTLMYTNYLANQNFTIEVKF